MRVVRQTPMAINKPLLILGVDRTAVGLLFILSAMLGRFYHLPYGIALFVMGFWAAKRATRKDPDTFKIWAVLFKMKPLYDPIKRLPYRMEITE